ncbi:MAG TPA: hypothetical protein PL157_10740 [Acidobacteriota bacterium]|nr:hypothetical protein [Acidobacteriota bacterium]
MPKATIDMVKINTNSWNFYSVNSHQQIWTNDAGEALSLSFFEEKPDIPVAIKPEKINELRKAYRGFAKQSGAAIISVEIVSICGIPSLEVILKKPFQGRPGFAFLGSVTIPLRDFSYVIRFESLEQGTTGIREATVMMLEQPIPQIDKQTSKILGWVKDPYDAKFDKGALYNLADQEKYDQMFEFHPLTRVRGHLHRLKQTIQIDSYVTDYPRHSGYWYKSIF